MFGVNPTTQFRKNNQHRHFKKYNVENDGRRQIINKARHYFP